MASVLRLFGLTDTVQEAAPAYVPPADAASVIGAGVSVKGELKGAGSLVILGHFEGDIALDGTIHVGPESRVDANITAEAIVVAGTVRGNLSAGTRVEILASGSLTGTVKSGAFAAADGAVVKGELWVERPGGVGEAAP